MNNSCLLSVANQIRSTAFEMLVGCKGGHYASSFSMVEIITALYFGGVLNVSPEDPLDPFRDRFILSKGHGAAALYAGLYHAGFIPRNEIDGFGKIVGRLGCTTAEHTEFGIEGYGGSLGHGLAYAGGIALACQMDGAHYYTYVLMGDGECQEGSIWEAALFIANQRLNSVKAIVDYNKIQAMGFVDGISSLRPLDQKWASFGWEVRHVDGHDITALVKALKKEPDCDKPTAIIAHTVKGKGLPFLENAPNRHFQELNPDEIEIGRNILRSHK